MSKSPKKALVIAIVIACLAVIAVLSLPVLVGAVWITKIEPSGEQRASERHHPSGSRLPGKEGAGAQTEMPDKVAIRIGGDGQIYLNEVAIDSRAPGSLPELTKNLNQLKKSCDAAQSQVLITIYASAEVQHKRVTDVMDSLRQAGLESVTFRSSGEE